MLDQKSFLFLYFFNAVLFNFTLIKKSWKKDIMIFTKILNNTFNINNTEKLQYTEGSCDTEDK